MSALKTALPKTLKELRIHLCQTSPGSSGVRQYVAENYTAIKQSNPTFPFLIREASGIQARAFARYDFGNERKVLLEGLSSKDVERKLEELVK